jgi:hypothetical protein
MHNFRPCLQAVYNINTYSYDCISTLICASVRVFRIASIFRVKVYSKYGDISSSEKLVPPARLLVVTSQYTKRTV